MDADRKLCTFVDWYKPMYNQKSSIISSLFDFSNLEACKDGYKIHLYKDKKIIYQHIKEKGIDIKIERINIFIEKNEELKKNGFLPFRLSGDADYELLNEKKCKKPQMHMFPNFSLLPVTGNLQIVKSNRPLKTFLEYDLQKYFLDRTIQSVPYRVGKQYLDNEKNNRKIKCEKEVLKALDIKYEIDGKKVVIKY